MKSFLLHISVFFFVIACSVFYPSQVSAGAYCNCPVGPHPHGPRGYEAFVIRVLENNNGVSVVWADNSINPTQCTEPLNSLSSTSYSSCPKATMYAEHIDSCSTTNYYFNFTPDWYSYRPIAHDYSCQFNNVTVKLKNVPAGYQCSSAEVGGIGAIPMTADCQVTVPNGWGSHWLTFWIEKQRTTIQGYKVKMAGNYTHTSINGQTITLANGATTIATTVANPYFFSDIDSTPTYTVSATLPAVNYSVGYTRCYNAINCHNGSVTLGNNVNVNSPPGGYTDLWWHYWEYVGWYRLKQASFTKQGGVMNFIPPDVQPYDGYDTDEELLNIRQPAETDGIGLITSGSAIDIGPITSNVSNKNWAKTYYTASKGYLSNLGSFLSYARARKEIKVITNINDLESDKINIFQGNLTLQNNTINPSRDNMVLIVQGNLTIQSAPGGNFNQARRSWGFIVTGQINIDPSITEMNGIFIANNYDLAVGVTSSTNPLKIVGNLISNTAFSSIKRYRPVADYQKASLYVVFYPEYYYDLIPYLSTITQEGRQLE